MILNKDAEPMLVVAVESRQKAGLRTGSLLAGDQEMTSGLPFTSSTQGKWCQPQQLPISGWGTALGGYWGLLWGTGNGATPPEHEQQVMEGTLLHAAEAPLQS